jgi:uncharacterized protein YuzE
LKEAGMKQMEQPVKALYDPETDILYLHFMDGTAEEVIEAGDNVIVELDEKGRIMGIEIWNASKRGVMEELRKAVMMSSKQ